MMLMARDKQALIRHTAEHVHSELRRFFSPPIDPMRALRDHDWSVR